MTIFEALSYLLPRTNMALYIDSKGIFNISPHDIARPSWPTSSSDSLEVLIHTLAMYLLEGAYRDFERISLLMCAPTGDDTRNPEECPTNDDILHTLKTHLRSVNKVISTLEEIKNTSF